MRIMNFQIIWLYNEMKNFFDKKILKFVESKQKIKNFAKMHN